MTRATLLVAAALLMSWFPLAPTFGQPGSPRGLSIETELKSTSQQMNRGCPVMVDKETRLDNTAGGPGNMFTYTFTLVNYGVEEINIQALRETIRPHLVNMVRTNPSMNLFRTNGVTIVYKYRDKLGRPLLDIALRPQDYQ